MSEGESPDLTELENDLSVRQVVANGICMRTNVVDEKLDKGNIEEAESVFRDGLSLNFEEARALLGKLEYQRGNVEGALRVFDGVDLQAAIQRMQHSLGDKQTSKKVRSRRESVSSVSQHATNLVLEAIYLKAKSLQKLGISAGQAALPSGRRKRTPSASHQQPPPNPPPNPAVIIKKEILPLRKRLHQTRIDYRTRLTVSIDCIRFLLKQGLPFRGHDESKDSSNRGNFLELL